MFKPILRSPIRDAVRSVVPIYGGLSAMQELVQLLFSNNEQGVFYVPQPVVDGQQVLFTDAAGTTPVTADGDLESLMLDLSQGLERGQELVVSANDASAWTPAGSNIAEDDDGEIKITYVDSANGAQISLNESGGLSQSLQSGKWYEIKFTFRTNGIRAGVLRATSINTNFNETFVHTESTEYSHLCYSDGGEILRVDSMSSGGVAWISNISVRELPGNHATTAISLERPLYSNTPPLQVYDTVDDAMTVTLPPITAATIATATPTGTVIEYPVDLSSGSYTITESHSGIIIREGELTADEQQQVTAYLNNLAGV